MTAENGFGLKINCKTSQALLGAAEPRCRFGDYLVSITFTRANLALHSFSRVHDENLRQDKAFGTRSRPVMKP